MALSVDFALGDGLKNALHEMKHDNKYRALIAVIEQENIQLLKTVDVTDSLTNDLESVRKVIDSEKVEACFVVVRLNDKEFGQVLLVPDTVKPKTRMLYASSSAHLRNSSGLPIGSDTHAIKVADLTPALFSRTEEETKQMMTEKEKLKEKIDAMPVAPATTAMAGVGCPLTPEAIKAVEAFSADEAKAATFTVSQSNITVDKTFPKDATTEAIISGVPADQPRYILIKSDGKVFLVYVCPGNLKPKERMLYAASKNSFIAEMGSRGIKFERRLEIDDINTIEQSIAESLQEVDLPKDVPVAPKANMMQKGPRMFM